jgi:hypothetical protein
MIIYEGERYYFAQKSLHSVLPDLDDFNLPCPSTKKEMLRWFASSPAPDDRELRLARSACPFDNQHSLLQM